MEIILPLFYALFSEAEKIDSSQRILDSYMRLS